MLFAGGLVFGDLAGTSNFPALDATAATVRAYFLHNASEVRALSFFHFLAALALLLFAAYLYMTVRELGAGWASVALAGGICAAVFLALSAICYRVLAEASVARDAPLAHGVVVASYLAGGPAIGAPLAFTTAALTAAVRSRDRLPAWNIWLGALATVLGAASATTFLGPANNSSVVYGILLLAAVVMFVWLVMTSFALASRTRAGASGQ